MLLTITGVAVGGGLGIEALYALAAACGLALPLGLSIKSLSDLLKTQMTNNENESTISKINKYFSAQGYQATDYKNAVDIVIQDIINGTTDATYSGSGGMATVSPRYQDSIRLIASMCADGDIELKTVLAPEKIVTMAPDVFDKTTAWDILGQDEYAFNGEKVHKDDKYTDAGVAAKCPTLSQVKTYLDNGYKYLNGIMICSDRNVYDKPQNNKKNMYAIMWVLTKSKISTYTSPTVFAGFKSYGTHGYINPVINLFDADGNAIDSIILALGSNYSLQDHMFKNMNYSGYSSDYSVNLTHFNTLTTLNQITSSNGVEQYCIADCYSMSSSEIVSLEQVIKWDVFIPFSNFTYNTATGEVNVTATKEVASKAVVNADIVKNTNAYDNARIRANMNALDLAIERTNLTIMYKDFVDNPTETREKVAAGLLSASASIANEVISSTTATIPYTIATTETQAVPYDTTITSQEAAAIIEEVYATTPGVPPIVTNTITPAPAINMTHSLVSCYRIDDANLQNLANYLWSGFLDSAWNTIQKLYSNPNDSLIDLYSLPAAFSGTNNENVTIGKISMTGVTGTLINNRVQELDLGYITIPLNFKSFLDYTTNIDLFLPFYGFVNINTSDAMGGFLHIILKWDVIAAVGLYEIRVTNKNLNEVIIMTLSTAGAMHIPMSSVNYNRFASSVMGTVGSVVSAVATEGASLAANVAAGVSAANTIMTSGGSVQRSSNLSSVGALGQLRPYVILTYPNCEIPDNFGQLYGYVSNRQAKIGSLENGSYNIIDKINLASINCSEQERNELESILKSGFYV